MTDKQIRVAVDIGGTFTDLQIHDPRQGRIHDFKAPSTPQDPSEGLIDALTGAAARYGFGLDEIGMILHGSTIATNAVLERKLPEGALITTRGFADVLEIGRHLRRQVYALKAEPRRLLIPRHRRFGVAERVRADGVVKTPLDRDAVRDIGLRLADDGVAAVAVVFLHAYRNPEHERAAAEILAAIPGLSIATSHEASPEIREYERSSTTVLNALLKPVISAYLRKVDQRLRAAGVAARLYLVQSNGGLAAPEEAARLPAKLLLSGPAGGAMALAALARRHGLSDLVGIDMGGTSSDVSVVLDGQVGETSEGAIDGLPVRLPMIEIRTIGAGGGSIARVEVGALRVGPESAGSLPGPACYGRGGDAPTVTDANLALGRIAPEAFLGGAMALDLERAAAALERVAGPLGLSVENAAAGIVSVATASMAAAVRLSLYEKGADPSDFTLTPFGGAAGLHACTIAEELEIPRIVFPATASTLSARGILDSDLRHDLSRSELIIPGPDNLERLTGMVDDLRSAATAALDSDRVPPARRAVRLFADLRYRGQAYEITTPWSALDGGAGPDRDALETLVATFHEIHLLRNGHSAPEDPVEIVTLRAVATGRLERSQPQPAEAAVASAGSLRKVYLEEAWRDLPLFERGAIGREAVNGPLIVQEDYTVLLIGSGWSLSATAHGDLIAIRKGDATS